MTNIVRHAAGNGVKSLPNIKNIIAVASGKGGVGKSTIAINLALALRAAGAEVGLLDADIYGPSQPLMLGSKNRPIINDDKSIQPIVAHGLQTMSIGYLVKDDTPAIWRGPMVSGALTQMLNSTAWSDLDYLIVDLPPGTGDVQLTLAQKFPLCGAVIVTTPQDVALLDVAKSIAMFKKVKVPILGVVENMGVHICSKCEHKDYIFGAHGGVQLALENNIKLLGTLPIDRKIRELSDAGSPVFLEGGRVTEIFADIASLVVEQLSLLPRDYSVPISNMVIETD